MNWQEEIIARLMAAPEYINPTIALALRAQRAELSGDSEFLPRAAKSGVVDRCISEGQREGEAVARALQGLGRANPAASVAVPVGF